MAFNNPIYIKWNETSQVISNEQVIVTPDSIGTLSQIPDSFIKVQIDEMYEIKQEEEILDETEFKVNYRNGAITFHKNKIGQAINIRKYNGLGVVYYPASRIYDDINGGYIDTASTLQDFINSIKRIGWQDNYDNTVTYFQNAIVYYPQEKTIYRCLTISKGNLPTNSAYWQPVISVKEASDYANTQGDYAKAQGDYAKSEGDYAKLQGDFANTATTNANNTINAFNNETIMIYKTNVTNYTDLAIVYPVPQNGWTVIVTSTNSRYRYNSTLGQWINIDIAPYDKIGDFTANNILEASIAEAIKNIKKNLNTIIVNVYLLGAKCDGVTDDWQVIQDYLNNNSSDYTLSFPMNTKCYISKTLVINDTHKNVHLIGQHGATLFTDKQIALIDFQGTWVYGGTQKVIQYCSVEKLHLIYSCYGIHDLWCLGGAVALKPDNYAGNINSIAIKANSFYTNKIRDCLIEGFGYGIQFNDECARNIITGNAIYNCRAPIHFTKNKVCNANIIKDNDLCNNVGVPIYIGVGTANVIRDNDIEASRRANIQLPNNEITFKDLNDNEIIASAIYLNNCSKTTITGNYFEGNNRWMSGLATSQLIQLDGIAKTNTFMFNNYYNIGNLTLKNTYTQDILGNSIINFEDGTYINEGGATNISGDNIVINPEFNFLSTASTTNACKTINAGTLFNMKDNNVVIQTLSDTVAITKTNSTKFNGFKTVTFNAQGCLMVRYGVMLNIPDNMLSVGKQLTLKFGMWVKSERIGTVTIYPQILATDGTRINTTICSQHNSKENEYQFITGYLTINNATKALQKNPYCMLYFIAPRFGVTSVTKLSNTQLKVACSYTMYGDTGSMFKVGDTVALSDTTSGVVSSINALENALIVDGSYSTYTPSGITHGVVTAYAEGHCNVSIECPLITTKGLLQPYSPQRMKNCVTKEYILDDSGTLSLSRDEFDGRYAIAESITLKYTVGSTACNGTVTCKQLVNGAVQTGNATISLGASTSGSMTLGTNQSNDYNLTYTNLNTLTSKKLIIKWWLPEEV